MNALKSVARTQRVKSSSHGHRIILNSPGFSYLQLYAPVLFSLHVHKRDIVPYNSFVYTH